jgi:hypothetical protein
MTPGRLAILLSAVVTIACGPRHPAPDTTGPRAEVAIEIESHHWGDVVISLYRDGVWERVGLAGAAKTTTFVLPWRRIGASGVIRLRAYALGGNEVTFTDQISVQPGQVIVWTLESSLDRSSVGVY